MGTNIAKGQKWIKVLIWVILGVVAVFIISLLIEIKSNQEWTGFKDYTDQKGEFH